MLREFKTDEQKRAFYNSKEWRGPGGLKEQALKNDNYECVWCKGEGRVTTREHATLEVDHIYEVEDYPELAYELKHLRTLCRWHHNMRHRRFEHAPKRKTKWEDERW